MGFFVFFLTLAREILIKKTQVNKINAIIERVRVVFTFRLPLCVTKAKKKRIYSFVF
jgi:hypothetical protein